MSIRRNWLPIFVVAGALGADLVGCAANPKTGPGELSLALTVAGGITINQVSYNVVSASNVTVTSGSFDVTIPGATASLDIALPPGTGFRITLSATSVSTPIRTFTGTGGPFDIISGQPTPVMVTLTDAAVGAVDPGTLLVNGTITAGNSPPMIHSAVAAAATVLVNSPVGVTAVATDAEGDTITYTWTATAGSFAAPNAATTTYSSSVAGPQTITLTVTDSHGASSVVSMLVTVIGPAIATCGAPSGGIWPDASGNGHNATLINFGAGSGLVGDGTTANPYAVTFDGVTNYAELAAGADNLRVTSEVTEEFWLNNNLSEAAGPYCSIFTNRNGDEYSGFWASIVEGQWTADATTDGATWIDPLLTTPGTPPSNTWTHLAATFSVSQGIERLYINGVQVASDPLPGPIFYSAASVPRVGGEPAGYDFRGEIAEVRIWGAPLSPDEVLARYETGAPTYGIVAPAPTMTVNEPLDLLLTATPCP